MDMTNLAVTKGLVAHKGSTSVPQVIQVTAHTDDIDSGILDLTWESIDADGRSSGPFATANIEFGAAERWMADWSPLTHLIRHRIDSLDAMAAAGQASRLSGNMAYTLWAHNLVDYAEKYRGMQSVVMHELEAYANVKLSGKDEADKFMIPPYFIDSVAHLAGFVMNCSDQIDARNSYCVTSGWKSMRFAEPLVAGAAYRSYVKMIPTTENPSVFLGDVYILRAEDERMIGMVGGIVFRRFPRVLLNHFFTAPEPGQTVQDSDTATLTSGTSSHRAPPGESDGMGQWSDASTDQDSGYEEPRPAKSEKAPRSRAKITKVAKVEAVVDTVTAMPKTKSQGPTTADKALQLIARETALDLADLEDQAEFSSLGIDSLMSLVLAEKFRTELQIKVNGSLFLDYPDIRSLRQWLNEYYS